MMRVIRPVVWPLALVLLSSCLAVQSAAQAGPVHNRRLDRRAGVTKRRDVPVKEVRPAGGGRARPVGPARPKGPAKLTWPAAGSATISASPAGQARPGGLPVTMGPPRYKGGTAPHGKIAVQVLDQATAGTARRQGVVVRLHGSATSGTVSLRLGYGAFADAYGGDWSDRLTLVRLPSCALTTPTSPQCAGAPLASRNDPAAKTVTADVPVAADSAGGTLVALVAAASSGTGDFTATPLKASSAWSAGGSSGDFAWTYPMRVPPSPGDLDPEVALSYSAQSVDGETAANNNQPSWVGEGFEYSPGSIERRFKACKDDGVPKNANGVYPGDLCWGADNAVLSLNGTSTELVRDDKTGAWRPRREDGSRVEHLTGNPNANGDDNGEYWKITTTDGTQYWFGLNQVGAAKTNSTWWVPVAGNNSGEPCHGATFDASFCNQAWRWNLDYVVDPHGNSMSFWYTAETNQYAKDLKADSPAPYVRGGHLTKIDYGTRVGAETGTAPMQVLFTTADRCDPGAGACSTHNAKVWPDTPWDEDWNEPCPPADSTCKQEKISPTFWTTQRLTQVTTRVRDSGGTGYRDVDAWKLRQSFVDPEDGSRAGLWLDGVTHTGLVGGSPGVTLPEVTFDHVLMPNRVDAIGDGAAAMNWPRLSEIHTETGADIQIGYSGKECAPGSGVPSAQDANTMRCFPVYYTKPGDENPTLNWFHKYVVTSVTEADTTGGAPQVTTTYDYSKSAPAWHFTDDMGLVPAKQKTWADWRGYDRVISRVGEGDEQQTTDTRYFRGMDGDRLSSGTRTATVPDDQGDPATDSDALAGSIREKITYDGSAMVTATVNDPWVSDPTATRTIDGSTVTARYSGVHVARTRTALDGGRAPRQTRTVTTFDDYGMPTMVDDQGDTSTSTDDRCVRTTYLRNTSAWLMDTVSRVETDARSCDKTPSSADDVISDVRTSFDGAAFGTAPTRGDITRTENISAWSASGSTYVTTVRKAYDAYGRVTDEWDALTRHTFTAYTPATGGPATKQAVTDPAGYTTTKTIDPAWGAVLSSTDANGHTTSLDYDPLGRLAAVWLPGRDKDKVAPDVGYEYLIRTDGANVVTAKKLNPNGGTTVGYALYDALLRLRQTQSVAPGGGRILTDTYYNSTGAIAKTYGSYYNGAAPGPSLVAPTDPGAVDDQTWAAYDGAGRQTDSIFAPGGKEHWRTHTDYGGDRVDVTPPAGGTATSTYTDARGQRTELRRYHGGTPSGAYDAVTYAYSPAGQLTTVTDPAGNVWRNHYDLRGRKVEADDPDKGVTRLSYDDADQLTSSTDARGQTLAYGYDALGRKTEERSGSTSGPLLASWTYDTLAKGQLTSSTRYSGGNQYTVAVTGYTAQDQPKGQKITIPAAEGKLAGSYAFTTDYAPDGSPQDLTYPSAGGLGAETVTYGYDLATGLPTTVASDLPDTSSYVTKTYYEATGELSSYRLDAGGPLAWRSFTYEPGTHRLAESATSLGSQDGTHVDDAHYTWDPSGNLTMLTDTPAGSAADTQCFDYDGLDRLTQAWTPASGSCTTAPSAAGLGGPAPYWQSWTFDSTGNRLTQTDHATSRGEVTVASAYPAAGQPRPHAPTSVTTKNDDGTRTVGLDYDADGATTTRDDAGRTQTLGWDAEGRLASSAEPGAAAAAYVYDADGNRLIAHDATGATLYLPGEELHLDTAGTVTATRYYAFADDSIAVRTPRGLTWMSDDDQNTPLVAIDAATQATAVRRQQPYGGERGTAPSSWPDDHAFLNAPQDPTGLVHLGAREYDPDTGRFLSVDPVLETDDPSQLNGYTYAADNPTTHTDPSGLMYDDRCYGDTCDTVPEDDRQEVNLHHSGVDNSPHPASPFVAKTSKTKKKETPRCRFPGSRGSCLDAKIHDENVNNGLDHYALWYADRHGDDCELGPHQVICYVDKVPGNRPVTVGDVLLYPGTRQDLKDRLAYDPHLLVHEGRHTQQARLFSSALLFAALYYSSAGVSKSLTSDNDDAVLNPFEITAGLKDGGYDTHVHLRPIVLFALPGASTGILLVADNKSRQWLEKQIFHVSFW